MPDIVKSPAAEADLIAHFVYLYDEAGEAVANRFLNKAERSFATIAAHPQIGRALTLRSPALTGMRKWAVEAFDNYLIFYTLRPPTVAIVRVLHRAQDWWKLLGLIDQGPATRVAGVSGDS
jgi:toxin ParE1/3/4